MAFAAFITENLQFLSRCNTRSAKPNHEKLSEIAKLLQTETKDSIRQTTSSSKQKQQSNSDSNSKSIGRGKRNKRTEVQKSPTVPSSKIACLRPGLDAGSTKQMIRNDMVDMELNELLLTYPLFVYNQMKSFEKRKTPASYFKTMNGTIKPEKAPDKLLKAKDNDPLLKHLRTLDQILVNLFFIAVVALFSRLLMVFWVITPNSKTDIVSFEVYGGFSDVY